MDVVRAQAHFFVDPHCRAFLDALPNMILALNCQRQVVFANQSAMSFLGVEDMEAMLGRRPGETLGCINATEHPSGCGTSRHCRSCGAIAAILSAIEGNTASGECKLLRRRATEIEGLDLLVKASPVTIDEQRYIVFSITDSTYESRRRVMERIFFHDVVNLAGGIRGLSEMLEGLVPDKLKQEFTILRSATDSLVEEVMAQRDVAAAENNELNVNAERIDALEILRELRGLYLHAPVAQGRIIEIDQHSANVFVVTDIRLVKRVLGNMLKNALEALSLGGTALLSCAEEGANVIFMVHNDGFIPLSTQDNIFHRTFSTKGENRGMGTYSMLLLAERYLKGSVGFHSTKDEGTVFYLKIPKAFSPDQNASNAMAS
jgi:signal transduction histidine kinase